MKGWAKTTRICVMMALDTAFLLLELGVGYYVSSLALIADGFHMLNDIISLAVGLWAVNLARKESNDRFSYGWLRAEILGAFFNATFLIGLCVTIVLEAIQRFFDPPNISQPQIVLIVGCFGLASNLVGFWVLGGHGHSHGGGGGDEEEGHDHGHVHSHAHGADDGHVHSHAHGSGALAGELALVEEYVEEAVAEDGHIHGPADDDHCAEETEEDTSADDEGRQAAASRHISFTPFQSHLRSASRSSAHSRAGAGSRRQNNSSTGGSSSNSRRVPKSIEDISIHPAIFRQDLREIIAARQNRDVSDEDEEGSDSSTTGSNTPTGTRPVRGAAAAVSAEGATERTPLISKPLNGHADDDGHDGHDHSLSHGNGNGNEHGHVHHRARRDSHGGHHHSAPREDGHGGHGGHGHSHGDMGMNAMVLHVIGDALGNIGVIVTALIIWKTEWSLRMYADPVVSLLITVIILRSAIPLTKATSKILLQATPDHLDLNDIREDIQDLEGVLSCHHIHVWQLSDSQIVASMHIEVAFPISEYGGERYMKLAKRVRKCLHGYGIHSATIQPEFRVDPSSAQITSHSHNHGHSHDQDHNHDHDHPSDEDSQAPTVVTGAEVSFSSAAAAAAAADSTATSTTLPPATINTSASSSSLAQHSSLLPTASSGLPAQHPSCLLDCVDDCVGKGCCSPVSRTNSHNGSHSGSHHGSPPRNQHDHDGHAH